MMMVGSALRALAHPTHLKRIEAGSASVMDMAMDGF
jgi:hypothetical protein